MSSSPFDPAGAVWMMSERKMVEVDVGTLNRVTFRTGTDEDRTDEDRTGEDGSVELLFLDA